MDGFLNLLKPPGMTSHDAVEFVRKIFPGVKVGHGGTLDPQAAGVLPILMGKATRLSSYLMDLPKIYRAELFLGVVTDTGDAQGKKIEDNYPPPIYKVEYIEKTLSIFLGEIEQIPPMYSAIKYKGKKLYEYARKGINLERKARKIKIYSLDLLDYYPPVRILFEVKCSSGTYIRALCSEIGEKLGCGGHMSFLLRKAVGNFNLKNSITLEDIQSYAGLNRLKDIILPLDYIFRDKDKVVLVQKNIRYLSRGTPLAQGMLLTPLGKELPEPVDGKILPVYTAKGEFVALARWKKTETDDFILKPEKVFST